MAFLLVTYDLNKETKRPNIVGAIKEISGSWAKLSESSYAVQTEQTPKTVYDGLKQFIDSNDNLYVINLRKPYYGQGPKDVNDWLESNLPG
ncbi:MAG: hypothetical protein RBS99_06455 [Rhodospirillales bacterium]|nr:hypothetical protein [Rhodospirillales bacterium]